jgi:hypothetical protein
MPAPHVGGIGRISEAGAAGLAVNTASMAEGFRQRAPNP